MKRCTSFFVLFLVLIMTVISTKNTIAEVRGVSSNTIKIGAILPITGPAASIAVFITEAIRNYTRYTNDNNGINGRKIKLIIEDDRYSIPPSIAALKKLLSKDRVFALLGPGSTSCLNVLWKKIQKGKLPTITLVPGEVAVTPFKRYIFTVADTYPGQVRALVDYLVNDYKIKETRVAIVYPDTEAGKTDLEPTLKRLKKYNLKPVTKEILSPGSFDASTQVMNMRRYKANCALHVGTITPTTMTLLSGLRKYGLKIPVFASWGAIYGEQINSLGTAAKQFYSLNAFSPWYGEGRGVKKMRKITLKYNPGSEKPIRGTLYTHSWVGTMMLVEGLKRAGKNIDTEKLIKALEGVKNFDTGNLCGPISYSPKSHKGGNSWKIYKSDTIKVRYIPQTGWRTVKKI